MISKLAATIHASDERKPWNPFLWAFVSAIVAYFAVDDWLAGVGIILLWAGWHYLPRNGGPPVLALAFTYQWVQVFSGIYYCGLTGRTLVAIEQSDYRPMVMIGAGCLVAVFGGVVAGARMFSRKGSDRNDRIMEAFSLNTLAVSYVAAVLLIGIIKGVAWQVPALTQGILAIGYLRYAILFLLFRQLMWPRLQWKWIAIILAGEIILGITGFFAEFREPLILAAIAMLEHFDPRKFQYWASMAVLGTAIFLIGLAWTGIKMEYRAKFEDEAFAESQGSRAEYVEGSLSDWMGGGVENKLENLDALVDRLWVIYYPALAVSRVPEPLPHTDGEIMTGAVIHILMPRFLFPDKEVLPSDSELVRKYSGVWVAGADQGTSIAFGYAGESYIDFGVPLMFLPMLVYGILMGMAYQGFLRLIRHRELAVALVTVVFWVSLYLFERSWIKTLGISGTMMIYVGGAVFLIDRALLPYKSWLRRKLIALGSFGLIHRARSSR